jgi:SAM-dependent methyltransferase
VYAARLYHNEGLRALVELIPAEQRRVLDIGCGDGANMSILAAAGHDVVGVTLSRTEAERVSARGMAAVVANLLDGAPFVPASFDAIILSHVLEHLPFPAATLRSLLPLLVPNGVVCVALPNVLGIKQRFRFLRGKFRYDDTGLMDRTHLRFFDFDSARAMMEEAGVAVYQHFGVGFVPSGPLRRLSVDLARRLDVAGTRRWPGLFAFHIIMVGRRA